ALESCGPAASATGNGRTLTLKLALAPVQPFEEPMEGSAIANPASTDRTGMLRAAVVPADSSSITLTF
ncbi:MAG TPA: hypothetical protein VLI46_02080, partial [Ramlibacter sp.]|nr:hypothetical protein [Ramlibacter sp.]